MTNHKWTSSAPKEMPVFDQRYIDRFWTYVDKTTSATGCWLWTGSKTTAGYGKYGSHHYGTYLCHRLASHLVNGSIPRTFACHKCDTPACCNPEHIFFGGQSENILDAVKKGRHVAANRRFTAEQIMEMRRAHSNKEAGYVTLGRKYGVSGTAIKQIIDRRAYKWVA